MSEWMPVSPLRLGDIRLPVERREECGFWIFRIPCWPGAYTKGRDPKECRKLLKQMVFEEVTEAVEAQRRRA